MVAAPQAGFPTGGADHCWLADARLVSRADAVHFGQALPDVQALLHTSHYETHMPTGRTGCRFHLAIRLGLMRVELDHRDFVEAGQAGLLGSGGIRGGVVQKNHDLIGAVGHAARGDRELL